MAKQVITMLTDDLTGDAADESIIFGIDGMAYTIDLSEDNAKELRTFMERYTAAGSRLGRIPTGGSAPIAGPGRRQGGTSPAKVDKEQNAAIRDWANRNGLQVAERGRISQHIVDAFHRGTVPKALQQDTLPTMSAPEPEPEAKPAARKVAAAKVTKAAPAKKTTARSAK